MLLAKRRMRKAEEEARRRAPSVRVKMEFRNIMCDFDEDKLLYLHMSPRAQDVFAHALEMAGDSVLGACQALQAKILKVKFAPRDVYVETAEAISKLYGVYLTPENGARILDALQPWRAHAYVFYDELPFARRISDISWEHLYKHDPDIAYAIWDFCGVSLKGYFKGAEVVDDLSTGDKVVLISTLRILDNKVELGGFNGPVAATYTSRDKELKGFHLVRLEGNQRLERPLFDGYIKVRFYDPELREFDKQVKEHLERLKKEDTRVVEHLDEIWENVRDIVHAVIPAYYNFLGVDPWKKLPGAVAEAVYELARKYVELTGAGEKGFDKKVVEEIARTLSEIYGLDYDGNEKDREKAMSLARGLVDKLVPGDVAGFARTRTPYLLYLIGEKTGAGFSPGKVIEYLYDKGVYKKLSQTLLRLGLVVSPRDLEKLFRKQGDQSAGAPDILVFYRDPETYTRYCLHSFYYALGIPVTRLFISKQTPNTRFTTVMSVKLHIEDPRLLDEGGVGLQDKKITVPRAGEAFLRAVDEVVNKYIDYVLNEYYRGEDRGKLVSDPRVYQAMLYIFSDLDLVKGSSKRDKPAINTRLLDILEETVFLTSFAVELDKRFEKDKEKTREKGKETKGYRRLAEQLKAINTRLDELREEILGMARLYNPKYVEQVSRKSESLYWLLLVEAEAGTKPRPDISVFRDEDQGAHEVGGVRRPRLPTERLIAHLLKIQKLLKLVNEPVKLKDYTRELMKYFEKDGDEELKQYIIYLEECVKKMLGEEGGEEKKKKEKEKEEEEKKEQKPPKPQPQQRGREEETRPEDTQPQQPQPTGQSGQDGSGQEGESKQEESKGGKEKN